MEKKEILKYVDHTLLSVTATQEEIERLCDDAIECGVASVCIPPCYVSDVKKYVEDRMKICTVIGFPNGYSTTEVKLFEAIDAIENGADEIDMVINVNYLKEGMLSKLYNEISLMKNICGEKILKVIVEACKLTEMEKEQICDVITSSKADFIKTSTGFSTGGATLEDVTLFAKHIGKRVKIKAAGGIRSFEQAEEFLKAGCSRLGTSALVKIYKESM